jgi:uncharacterized membrane protein YqjE
MPTATSQAAPPPAGIFDSFRSFVATWVAVIKTRVDIVSTELEEQREWMQQLVILAVAATFALSIGLVVFTLFITMLFWEDHRLLVLGSFSVLYLGAGIIMAVSLRKRLKSRPRIFTTTSEELTKDYARLQRNAP